MERFFLVQDVMMKLGLEDVLHLEVDNMVYFCLEDLLPAFKMTGKILAPSDNDTRFIAGVCFIPNVELLNILNSFFAQMSRNQAEMEVMMQFSNMVRLKDEAGNVHCLLESLPVVMPEYLGNWQPLEGAKVNNTERFHQFASDFRGLFDAAAVGQYLGGIDKIHNPGNTDGYVNPHAAYRVDSMETRWSAAGGKRRPEMRRKGGVWWPLLNLHIHSKDLARFE